MKVRILFRALALVCLGVGANAQAAPYDDLVSTFKSVGDSFEARYALEKFKEETFGWDIQGEITKLEGQAMASPNLSLLDTQVLLNQFFLDLHDYHAQVIYKGMPYVEVPIGVHSAEHRVFVTHVISPSVPAAGAIPNLIQVGDEVLTYDGIPVWKTLKALMTKPVNMHRTDRRDAERRLTARYGMLMDPLPPTKTLTLTLRNAVGQTYTQVLTWGAPVTAQKAEIKLSAPIDPDLQGIMDSDPYGYTSVKSYLPKPKTVTWESATAGNFYYAWTGLLPSGKRIGMIRINNFSLNNEAAYAAAVTEFKGLVVKMNAETDALILDTQGNRGGLLDYAYALIAFFIDQPTPTYNFSYRLFPSLITGAQKEITDMSAIHDQAGIEAYFGADTYGGYPVTLDVVKDMIQFHQNLVDDAAAGHNMGRKGFYNYAKITPYPGVQHYLKPLFVMTDEWSASCGDTFAAYLQDIGRATIIGGRTSGAGAFVGNGVGIPGPMNISAIHVPLAVEYRLDGSMIENQGVTPDYELHQDATDLQTTLYPHYQQKLYDIIESELEE